MTIKANVNNNVGGMNSGCLTSIENSQAAIAPVNAPSPSIIISEVGIRGFFSIFLV